MLRRKFESCFIFETGESPLVTEYWTESDTVFAGSFPLRTYLPESDLDLVLFTRNNEDTGKDIEHILAIFNALCREIALAEDDRSVRFKIRNVEFINARIKLSKCYINNIGVDITVNQVGSLATLVFLEEADRAIGHDSLFKRSLLLIKVGSQLR